jgi:hypothetical protein
MGEIRALKPRSQANLLSGQREMLRKTLFTADDRIR